MDQLKFEVQVTDETGKPLVGAVLWYVGRSDDPSYGVTLTTSDFQRMASRYAAQGDFLVNQDLPGAVIRRTGLNGEYRNFMETRYPDNRYPYIVVATKRGYTPQVTEGVAPLNTLHVVRFQLKRDPVQQPDPRMERLDNILAQARTVAPGEDSMGEPRMRKLVELEQQARSLAAEFEHEGKGDEASAVYWSLAEFPEVISTVSSDGTQKVVGYRASRTGEKSETDRRKAIMLNASIPKLLIDKARLQHGLTLQGINSAEQGDVYLSAFMDQMRSARREQILPHTLVVATWQAIRWSTGGASCDLFGEALLLEPKAFRASTLVDMQHDLDAMRKKQGLAPAACTIQAAQN
jgi:hypothetical protein